MKTEDFKLISIDEDKALYEGGYWMTKKNYDFINFPVSTIFSKTGVLISKRPNLVLSVDRDTKEVKYAFLPEV